MASQLPELQALGRGARAVLSLVDVVGNSAWVRFGELSLTTAFQPVVSLAHGRPVGFEALLRATDGLGRNVPPLDVFASRERDDATLLDSLCYALHTQSYRLHGSNDGWLLLNVSPTAINTSTPIDELIAAMLAHHNFPAHRLVVEVLESRAPDEARLASVVRRFHELGCVVAIDDFGAGHSNFERIWRLQPDIVKLDRSMVAEASRSSRVRRILGSLVSLIHEAQCLVILEGIETADQALLAMDVDADFVQGFYFGAPEPTPNFHGPNRVSELLPFFRKRVSEQSRAARDQLQDYRAAMRACAEAIQADVDFEQACAHLLKMRQVDRCYLLASDGTQIGTNLESARVEQSMDPRFLPFSEGTGANWFRRPYFRHAMSAPGTVHVSQPYLSIRDARTCVTLSIAFEKGTDHQVLCTDLDWDAEQPMPSSHNWRAPTGR